ncbi:hypothetical protein [Saccharopolyspora shandongensis]|uniref:hypothetical protein n=1 Tax=Saccharopolyspora shandongensis TaxID=418495 RepID=UPI0034055187
MGGEGNNSNELKHSSQANKSQVDFWTQATNEWTDGYGAEQMLNRWAAMDTNGPTKTPEGFYNRLLATRSKPGLDAAKNFAVVIQGIHDSANAFFKDQSQNIQQYLHIVDSKMSDTEKQNLGLAKGTGLEGSSGSNGTGL